ncbi:hypothetical protein RAA17_25190 [Komagataeibacter rhaeticus]|nr:hypothetical protein [Komagataeibacter rhaeticus]
MKIRTALEQAPCLPPRRGTVSGKVDLSLQDGLARLAHNPELVPIAGEPTLWCGRAMLLAPTSCFRLSG